MRKFYERVCKSLSGIISHKTRVKVIEPELKYDGIKEDYALWVGQRILIILLAGIIGTLLPFGINYSVEGIPQIALAFGIGLGLAIISAIIIYINLYYKIEGRASLVENVLPDFLMLVASNINAGMTPFSAFRNAARKEFGPLSVEIKIATAKALGTQSFNIALTDVSKKIKSKSLEETVAFFNQSLRSGGHLAQLLESSATALRQTQEMKKELLSNTKMYVIFVLFVVVIASPLLLSVSVQFLKMITKIQAESAATGLGAATGQVSFLSAEIAITPEFMILAAYSLLLINSLLSSLFIGVLVKGRATSGINKFPLILAGSFIFMLITLSFLDQFFAVFIYEYAKTYV